MAKKVWQVEKTKHCEHMHEEIAIEVEVVYPAEHLPEQAPRVRARRCSKALECNCIEHPACSLSGTKCISKCAALGTMRTITPVNTRYRVPSYIA